MIALILSIVLSTALLSTIFIVPKALRAIELKDSNNALVKRKFAAYTILFIYFCIATPLMITIIFNDTKIQAFADSIASGALDEEL